MLTERKLGLEYMVYLYERMALVSILSAYRITELIYFSKIIRSMAVLDFNYKSGKGFKKSESTLVCLDIKKVTYLL